MKVIADVIEAEVKSKLWEAFIAQQSSAPTRQLVSKFNDFFYKNTSLRILLLELKDRFFTSKRTDDDLKVSISDYFYRFEAVLFDYLAEISTIAAMDIAEIDNAFASLRLTEVERLNAVKLAEAGTTTVKGRPVDLNVQEYLSQGRLLRRMDSLARLLSVSSTTSVCTAVTIYNGELYIGSNVSGATPQADMVNTFLLKLLILKNFIEQIKKDDLGMTDDALTDAIQNCVQRLIKEGGSLGNESVLQQALFKFVDTIRARHSLEGHTSTNYFSRAEVNAILSPRRVTVLLPYGQLQKHRKGSEINSIGAHVADGSGQEVSKYPLPEQLQHLVVKDFHAEQLIAIYLQNQKDVDLNDALSEKIRIGLTKLCCRTCFDVLRSFQRLELRGTHNVSYSNVADVFSATTCGQVSTPNFRETAAKPSPGDTPLDDINSPSTITGKRRYKIAVMSSLASPEKENGSLKKSGTCQSIPDENQAAVSSSVKKARTVAVEPKKSSMSYLSAAKVNLQVSDDSKMCEKKSLQKRSEESSPHPLGSPNGVAGAASFFSPKGKQHSGGFDSRAAHQKGPF